MASITRFTYSNLPLQSREIHRPATRYVQPVYVPPIPPEYPELKVVAAQWINPVLRVYVGSAPIGTPGAGSFTIDGPVGKEPLTVVDVLTVESIYVDLVLSNTPEVGTYTVTVAAGALAADGYDTNVETTVDWDGIPFEDLVNPMVGNFSPAPGTKIASGASISFDVTDETSLGQVLVAVRFPLDGTEVIHDGTKFMRGYSGTMTAIPNGWHYTVYRTSGWGRVKGPPTIAVYAIDKNGNKAV